MAIRVGCHGVVYGISLRSVSRSLFQGRSAHSRDTSMDEITDEDSLRVPAMDVEAWTAIMQRLLDNINAATIGRSERRVRSHLFSWTRSAETVLRIYDQLS